LLPALVIYGIACCVTHLYVRNSLEQESILNYTKKENPKVLRVFYLNPLDESNFKNGEERLITVFKKISP